MDVDTRKLGASLRRLGFFDTFAAAHEEATRRRSEDAAHGLISKVVKSPYGGFVIRVWPLEMFAEPELRSVLIDRRSAYPDP